MKKPLDQECASYDAEQYRERIARRIRINCEDEVARRILRAVGREDLCRWLADRNDGFEPYAKLSVQSLYKNYDFVTCFPMRLEYVHRSPMEPEPKLKQLLGEFSGSVILRSKIVREKAVGLITLYGSEYFIIHNRPQWADGDPRQAGQRLL